MSPPDDDPYLDHRLNDSVAPPKIEIARLQIEGAIRSYLWGAHPIVVHTLLAPAYQVLRDLNRDTPHLSPAEALSELAEEAGLKRSEFWRDFNDKTANYLKHATRLDDVPTIARLNESVLGILSFCLLEYLGHKRVVSPIMLIMIESLQANRKKLRRVRALVRVFFYDANHQFWIAVTRTLMRLQQRMRARATSGASPGL